MAGQGPLMQLLCQHEDQIENTVTERNVADPEKCFSRTHSDLLSAMPDTLVLPVLSH